MAYGEQSVYTFGPNGERLKNGRPDRRPGSSSFTAATEAAEQNVEESRIRRAEGNSERRARRPGSRTGNSSGDGTYAGASTSSGRTYTAQTRSRRPADPVQRSREKRSVLLRRAVYGALAFCSAFAVLAGIGSVTRNGRHKSAQEEIIDRYMEEGTGTVSSAQAAQEDVSIFVEDADQTSEGASSGATDLTDGGASVSSQPIEVLADGNNQTYADIYETTVIELPDVQDSYYFAGSDTRYLSENDIAGYSREEIQLIVNEIYARHGRVFRQESNEAFFWSKSWYMPVEGKSDEQIVSEFNAYEKANVDFLAQYL